VLRVLFFFFPVWYVCWRKSIRHLLGNFSSLVKLQHLSGDKEYIWWILHRPCASDSVCYIVCLHNTIEYFFAYTWLYCPIRLRVDRNVMNAHLQNGIMKRPYRACVCMNGGSPVENVSCKTYTLSCRRFLVQLPENMPAFLKKSIMGTLHLPHLKFNDRAEYTAWICNRRYRYDTQGYDKVCRLT